MQAFQPISATADTWFFRGPFMNSDTAGGNVSKLLRESGLGCPRDSAAQKRRVGNFVKYQRLGAFFVLAAVAQNQNGGQQIARTSPGRRVKLTLFTAGMLA